MKNIFKKKDKKPNDYKKAVKNNKTLNFEEILNDEHMTSSAKGIIKGFEIAIHKMNYKFIRQIYLGILGGAILALAYVACIYGTLGITTPGVASLINGTIFPAGIILITFVGGGLYTSHVTAFIPTVKRSVRINRFITGIFGVYLGNFLGTGIIAILIELAGCFDDNSKFAVSAFGVAMHKLFLVGTNIENNTSITLTIAIKTMLFVFGSGILCNILVSATIPGVGTTKSDPTKVILMFFMILFFMVSGYQHSPANTFMFWVLLIEAINKTDIGAHTVAFVDCIYFLVFNLVFSFIGNFIGGGILTPGILVLVNKKYTDAFFAKARIEYQEANNGKFELE